MTLSEDQLAKVEAAIEGANGPELMRLMGCITSYGKPDDFDPAVLELARDLDLMDESARPTFIGWEVGDPMREFELWNGRDRRVHCWEELPVMRSEYFEGKKLLSVGCGCGTNLLTLQSLCSSVTGIERIGTYLQFTPIWARLAGVETPETILAPAEDMPFEDDSFDVVVCFGALQYMNIPKALSEIGRVTRSDGLAVLTLSNLNGFLAYVGGRMMTKGDPIRRPRGFAEEALTVATTLVYPWTGRIIERKQDPVYPTFRRMKRWLDDVGLDLDDHLTRGFGHEVCYVGRKR